MVAFEVSRADGADSQAGTTGTAALAIGAIAASVPPEFNAMQIAAACFLLLATIAAVIARARYPPPLRLLDGAHCNAHHKRCVNEAEERLRNEFGEVSEDNLRARSLIAEVWIAMAARERFRAARKNRWLTVSLYGLWLGVVWGVVGFVVEG